MKFASMQVANALLFAVATYAVLEGVWLYPALVIGYIGINYLVTYGLEMTERAASIEPDD